MARIIESTEEHGLDRILPLEARTRTRWAARSTKAAVEIGELLGAKYLITFTQSGDSATRMSRLRPRLPMLAFTPDAGHPLPARPRLGHRDLPRADGSGTPTRWPSRSTRLLLAEGRAQEGDLVVIVAGSPPGIPGSTNALRVHRDR